MNNATERKTLRKNKTNQIINWPSASDFFTIDTLININQHMLTEKGSDITLRVRLMKAVKEEPKTIAVIGTLNRGKGRPQLAFAMKPVQQVALDKAKSNKIMLLSESELVPVMSITKPIISVIPVSTPTKIKISETVIVG